MLRMTALAFLALVLASGSSASAACSGSDPAITSVGVKSVEPAGNVNRYHLTGTVVNEGNQSQASNVLQFVDIYQGGVKVDAKGIPALAAGQSYAFSYVAQRSQDAGKGTTNITFKLDFREPNSSAHADCSAANDAFTVTF